MWLTIHSCTRCASGVDDMRVKVLAKAGDGIRDFVQEAVVLCVMGGIVGIFHLVHGPLLQREMCRQPGVEPAPTVT